MSDEKHDCVDPPRVSVRKIDYIFKYRNETYWRGQYEMLRSFRKRVWKQQRRLSPRQAELVDQWGLQLVEDWDSVDWDNPPEPSQISDSQVCSACLVAQERGEWPAQVLVEMTGLPRPICRAAFSRAIQDELIATEGVMDWAVTGKGRACL